MAAIYSLDLQAGTLSALHEPYTFTVHSFTTPFPSHYLNLLTTHSLSSHLLSSPLISFHPLSSPLIPLSPAQSFPAQYPSETFHSLMPYSVVSFGRLI